LTALAKHQLTPELAEPLSNVDLAIFVDARCGSDGDAVKIHALEPSNRAGLTGHTSNPEDLLALTHMVYGRHPTAWLVSVPGTDFSLHEGLSTTTSEHIAGAIAQIAALIETSCGEEMRQAKVARS
jgi:Ni,Fe-hydrogenase maturation factor